MDMLIKTEPPDDQEYCHGKTGGCKLGGVMDMLIKTEPPDDQEYCHGMTGGCKLGGGGHGHADQD